MHIIFNIFTKSFETQIYKMSVVIITSKTLNTIRRHRRGRRVCVCIFFLSASVSSFLASVL